MPSARSRRWSRWASNSGRALLALLGWLVGIIFGAWRSRASLAGGLRLALLAGVTGLAIGWLAGERVNVTVTVRQETELPRPVTPAPPGTRWTRVLTTGYCPCAICCAGSADGKTATGRDVRSHPFGIASDPKRVRPGLRLDIPGYGQAQVDDTGGAMRQSGRDGVIQLDLRFTGHEQARRWGRRWMWIALPER